MKAFNFSTKSLHWRLAARYGSLNHCLSRDESDKKTEWYTGDMCEYITAVLRGACVVVLLIMVGGIFMALLGHTLAFLAASAGTGVLLNFSSAPIAMIIPILVLAVLAVVTAFLVSTALSWISTASLRALSRKAAEAKPGFIQTAYKSIREKACARITVN